MAIDWRAQTIDLVDFAWDQLTSRLEGLTEAEYLWEPAPGCWSVRLAPDGRWRMDGVEPEPQPAPLTTIAWRMAHLGQDVLGHRSVNQFGADGDPDLLPGDAAAAIDWLQSWYQTWIGSLRALTAEQWDRPTGPTEGPFAEAPFLMLVMHIHREVIHHTAEIALLRDLYYRLGAEAQTTPFRA